MKVLLAVLAIISLLAVSSMFLVRAAQEPGKHLAGCARNLKDLGTALEMYSTDASGRFPAALSQLTPGYLKSIPTCPAAGIDTYSHAFKTDT